MRASRWPNGPVAEAVVVTDRDGLQQAWDTVLDDDQHRWGLFLLFLHSVPFPLCACTGLALVVCRAPAHLLGDWAGPFH